jgi:hypothetical protein
MAILNTSEGSHPNYIINRSMIAAMIICAHARLTSELMSLPFFSNDGLTERICKLGMYDL